MTRSEEQARRIQKRAQYDRAATVRPWRIVYGFAYGGDEYSVSKFYWTKLGARWSAFFIVRSMDLTVTAELFRNLPKPKASVPSSLGMVRKW